MRLCVRVPDNEEQRGKRDFYRNSIEFPLHYATVLSCCGTNRATFVSVRRVNVYCFRLLFVACLRVCAVCVWCVCGVCLVCYWFRLCSRLCTLPDGVAALLNSYVVYDLGLDLSFATDLWTTRRVRFKWRFKKLCVTNYQLPTATNNILISLCDNPPSSKGVG